MKYFFSSSNPKARESNGRNKAKGTTEMKKCVRKATSQKFKLLK